MCAHGIAIFSAVPPTNFTVRTLEFCGEETSCLESLDFPKLIPAPDTAPERAETGTQNHEGIVGAAAAVEFLASLAPGATRRERLRAAFAGLHERGADLLTQLWNGLTSIRRSEFVRTVA